MCMDMMRAMRLLGDAYREGGDEVITVMRGLKPEDALRRMRDLLRRLGLENFEHEPLTGSIGLAVMTNPDEDVHALKKRANEAMYRAKGESRNPPRRSFLPSTGEREEIR
jgi:diguanylate cyclase (GGDEF)-like protein